MKSKRIPTPHQWKDLKTHPLAALVPYGQGIDTVGLAEHMRGANGYDHAEPIVLFDGMILDGRHRHVAAQEADVEPIFVEFVEGDLIAFVAKKLHRQHLNESQRAMFVVAMLRARHELDASKPNENQGANGDCPTLGISQAKTAQMADVSRNTITDAEKVTDEASEEVKQEIMIGQARVSQAAGAIRTVFCRNCRIYGPKKKCQDCVEKRKEMGVSILRPPAPDKPKKSGDAKFDFRDYDKHLGPVIRGLDNLAKAYPEVKETEYFKSAFDALNVYATAWKAMQRIAWKLPPDAFV